MKFLLKMHDKQRPNFEPGGKMERLYPLFEAQDTFLFTPAEVTHGAPHVRDALDIKRLMITVVIALIPCVLFGIWNAGYQYNVVNQTGLTGFMDHMIRGAILVMPIILTSYIVGGLWEVGFAIVRKHPINEGFLVSGLLFPLTLPPTIPLWQVAVGISFGIVIGKEVFGGTGFNVLNPALTARAFLYFAYPAQITGDKVWTATIEGGKYIEGFTGATPLGIGMVPHDHSLIDTLNGMGFTLSVHVHRHRAVQYRRNLGDRLRHWRGRTDFQRRGILADYGWLACRFGCRQRGHACPARFGQRQAAE